MNMFTRRGIIMKTKTEKRNEALERQVTYEAMTIQDRINNLDKCGFGALKERSKLKKQLK